MTNARFTDAASVQRFLLGGHAIATLVSSKTRERFTYRVSAVTGEGGAGKFFVSVLTGPANGSDYLYVGLIVVTGSAPGFYPTRGKGVLPTAPSSRAWQWFWRGLRTGRDVLRECEVWHEGRCGRCARLLTVPASIELGFGPECAELLGLERPVSSALRRFNEIQQTLPLGR